MKSLLAQTFCILFLICLLGFNSNVGRVKCESGTITVPDDYPTIQAAIDGAHDGATIFVRSGVYYEYLTINKSLSLMGEDPVNTVINGNRGRHFLISISANDVIIRNFMITNFTDIAIYINRSTDEIITGNNFFHIGEPVVLEESENALIQNNMMFDVFTGVRLWLNCNNTVIDSNRMSEIAYGVYVYNSSYNTISGNVVKADVGDCVDVSGISSIGNKILYNQLLGISDPRSERVHYGRTYFYVEALNTTVYGNDFINISMFVYNDSVETWNNGSAGNYWSDYNGTDANEDGIGDSPYSIYPYQNIQDEKPLMSPNFLLRGDVNLDGTVDLYDALQGASAFGSTRGEPNWNAFADFNKDGTIDIFDLIIVAQDFGKTFPSI